MSDDLSLLSGEKIIREYRKLPFEPFSRVLLYFMVITDILAILVIFFELLIRDEIIRLIEQTMTISRPWFVDWAIYGVCFAWLALSILLFLFVGEGWTDIILTNKRLLFIKTWNPFFLLSYQKESRRATCLSKISNSEVAKISSPDWILLAIGVFIEFTTLGFLMVILIKKINRFLLISVISLVISTIFLVAVFFFLRRNIYQLKLLIGSPMPFPHPFEFCYGKWFSTGLWIVRSFGEKAKTLFDSFQFSLMQAQTQFEKNNQ